MGEKRIICYRFFFYLKTWKFSNLHISPVHIYLYTFVLWGVFFFYSFEIKNSVRGVIVCNERKRLLYIPISRLLGTILMEIPFFFSAPRLTVVSFIILFKTMYEKAVVEIAEIQFDSLCFENVGWKNKWQDQSIVIQRRIRPVSRDVRCRWSGGRTYI